MVEIVEVLAVDVVEAVVVAILMVDFLAAVSKIVIDFKRTFFL